MRHTLRSWMLSFLSSGALLGCSTPSFDQSTHIKHVTLKGLGAYGLEAEVSVRDGSAYELVIRLGGTISHPFRDPECPVVDGLYGTLDGVAMTARAGGAEEYEDFSEGAGSVLCKSPFLFIGVDAGGEEASLKDGEHYIEIWDASARLKLSFTLLSSKRSAVIEVPTVGIASIGDKVILKVSPVIQPALAEVTFVDENGQSQFWLDTSTGLTWVDGSILEFIVPDVTVSGSSVVPGKGRFDVSVEGWENPSISECTGAAFCEINFVGTDVLDTDVSVPFEIRE